MKHAILGAIALVCVFVAPVHARDLHSECNVTMPCQVQVMQKNAGHVQIRRSSKNVQAIHEIAGGDLVSRARAYMGQTARQVGVRATLWCSDFLIHITGASGVDARARSWLAKQHVSPQVGAIAVVSRGGSPKNGHVGLVSGFTPSGDPILISGNHGGKVGEGVYSARRVLAYVSI